jgi:hypothetical protein
VHKLGPAAQVHAALEVIAVPAAGDHISLAVATGLPRSDTVEADAPRFAPAVEALPVRSLQQLLHPLHRKLAADAATSCASDHPARCRLCTPEARKARSAQALLPARAVGEFRCRLAVLAAIAVLESPVALCGRVLHVHTHVRGGVRACDIGDVTSHGCRRRGTQATWHAGDMTCR